MPKAEARAQVELLATLVPAFCTILPADRDNPQKVLRVNFNMRYRDVRSQLLAEIAKKVSTPCK